MYLSIDIKCRYVSTYIIYMQKGIPQAPPHPVSSFRSTGSPRDQLKWWFMFGGRGRSRIRVKRCKGREAGLNETERWVNSRDKMLPRAFMYSLKPVGFSICVESERLFNMSRASHCSTLEEITSVAYAKTARYESVLSPERGRIVR